MTKFVLFSAAALGQASHSGEGCPPLHAAFADMHDGDEKEVSIKDNAMTIKPHGDEKWIVNTDIDCNTQQAIVDFHVPGKSDYPPVPLTASIWSSHSAKSIKSTVVYTDPSGTLADDPTFPLNQWVEEESVANSTRFKCPEKFEAVFADMHDGDMKSISIKGEKMVIKPSGNDQEWIVNAKFDPESCSASVDFNVPGKPDFPPVPLLATFWMEYSVRMLAQSAFEFTDPSGTIATPAMPLNRWIEIKSSEVHV